MRGSLWAAKKAQVETLGGWANVQVVPVFIGVMARSNPEQDKIGTLCDLQANSKMW